MKGGAAVADGDRPIVLVPLATARRAARRAGVTLNLSAEDIALAGKWKHGWIPLDAVASAVKAKRYHGGGGEGRTVKGKGRAGSAVESRREPSRGRSKVRPPAGGHRPKSPQLVQSDVYGNGQTDRYRLPSGHEVQVDRRTGRVNARDLYGEHRPGKSALDANPDAFEGHYEGSGMQRSGYYTLKAHDVSRVTGENLAAARAARPRMSREDAHVAVQRGHMTPAQARKATAPPLEGKSAGSMTAAERAKAAEVMYGTGSKQHRKALATTGKNAPVVTGHKAGDTVATRAGGPTWQIGTVRSVDENGGGVHVHVPGHGVVHRSNEDILAEHQIPAATRRAQQRRADQQAATDARLAQMARDRTRRLEAARGGPKLAELSESDLQSLISRYGEKSVQADAARAEMLRRGMRKGPR